MKIDSQIKKVKNLEEEKEIIEKIANRDQLTNLYNRRYLENFQKEIYHNQIPFGLIILDIDYFKTINDCYGHEIGDTVLLSFAKLLQEETRTDDIVIRYGGEEFIIIYKRITEKILLSNAERLRKSIEKMTFYDNQHITASFGIVMLDKNFDIYENIKKADIALYRAKEKGRNRVEMYREKKI